MRTKKTKSTRKFAPISAEAYMKPLHLAPDDRLYVRLADDSHFSLSIYDARNEGSKRGYMASHEARYTFMDRFPQKKESGLSGESWVVPATDVPVMLIYNLWPEEHVTFSEEAKLVYDYLALTVIHQSISVQRAADYHAHIAGKKIIQGFPIPRWIDEVELKPAPDGRRQFMMLHQVVATLNCLNAEGYGEFMEQGTGKTMTVIGRVCMQSPEHKEKTGRKHFTLIVTPSNVRKNWVNEFEKYAWVRGHCVDLRGGQFERYKTLLEAMSGAGREGADEEQYVVIVCSYDCLSNSWDILGRIEWDLAVLDESHYIKWHQAKRTKFAYMLRDQSRARMALTGTPMGNTPMDLFSQLEFLRKGGSGFTSFESFRQFYGVFETVDGTRGRKRMVDVQNLPFLRERLAAMSFTVTQEEAMPDLPDLTYDMIEVEMVPEQAAAYRDLRDKLFLEIKRDLDDTSKTLTPQNILTRLLRLSQITSGFVCYDAETDENGEPVGEREIGVFEPNPKLEELVKQLVGDEDNPVQDDEKTLVWALYKFDIDAICERLDQMGIKHVRFTGETAEDKRLEVEHQFNNDPETRVFVGSAAAGGTGLNLIGYPPGRGDEFTTDVTRQFFFSQNWSALQRSQAEKRAHRRGTRRPVRCIDLTIVGTIDEEIRARVVNKRQMAAEVKDVRAILKKVLESDL